ncbi:uncharacterized protein NEMAJ01_1740 [Nematocida major]|uniref:uncharacterized protein n=1 Tax=Nematocida major TaxID=1912982 RepID=UPI0020072BB7|nr:uncharacterized protein NEMAJ01_1740 [Nematocida major]KAH9386844.1 hypothetical protein NEMAJ01_1740 [Nematocida major]
MERVLEEIQTEYADIKQARALMVQSDFSRASEIYSQILAEMSAKEAEDSLKMCAVYLEYSKCLFLSNDKLVLNPEIEEDNEYLEDLGIAWEVLEIAKNTFRKSQFTEELIKVHILLSDIAQETNNFESALEDLTEAHALLKGKSTDDSRLPDISFRIAIAHEELGNTEKAIEMLEQLLEILGKSSSIEGTAEIMEEVREKIDRIRNPEKYKLSLTKVQKVVEKDQPVQKIKLGKSGKAPSDKQEE